MSWVRRLLLAIALVVAFGVAAEIWSSWRSERSGPFAYFYDPAKSESRYEQARDGISAYLSHPRSSAEAIREMEGAGFSCRPIRNDSAIRRATKLGISLGVQTICSYPYARYFMYPIVYHVIMVFDADDKMAQFGVGEHF